MSGASGGGSAKARASALRRAAAALGVAESARLADSLLAVAAEAVERDLAFAARVRSLLTADSTAHGAQAGAATKPTKPTDSPRLVPLARISDAVLDPFGPPDPVYLYRLYGAEQLPTALAQYAYASLREAAARLFSASPTDRPPLPRGKAALIAAITAHVVEQST